jgi:DNA-binding NarL/FixJ family response regulator
VSPTASGAARKSAPWDLCPHLLSCCDRAVESGGSIRVWVDDRNAIFRRGLVSCLSMDDFTVVGESAGFSPEPDLTRTDILLFSVEDAGLQRAVRLVRGTAVRLVGLARSQEESVLFDAVQAGLAGFLIRSELTPAGLAGSLHAVLGGNGSMPPELLARMLHGLAKGGARGASAGQLAHRELDVLRLLAEGNDTREIAASLSYSERTVKNIVHDVLVKMNCRSRAHAVALATRQGFI